MISPHDEALLRRAFERLTAEIKAQPKLGRTEPALYAPDVVVTVIGIGAVLIAISVLVLCYWR